jgi:hypothetical protein
MSMSVAVQKTMSLGGKSFSETASFTGDKAVILEKSIPAAEGGALTTRTSDTAGTITMDSGSHTITTGDRVDLYWSGGECRNATVGTVSGTSVPITAVENGDVLPSQSSDITVAPVVEEAFDFAGDNLKSLLCYAPKRSTFVLTGSDDAEDYARVLAEGRAFHWGDGNGDDNPVAGDTVAKVFMSHDDESSAQVLRVGVLFD